MLKRYLALRLEVEMFVNKKGKFMAEISDEKWLWDFALLSGIRHNLNNLSTKL